MVSVGIVGGSGYMGGEALRVLLRHPQADIAWVTRTLINSVIPQEAS
jgi:N-acetyl-gamma-glutamyl-phosphate reductase